MQPQIFEKGQQLGEKVMWNYSISARCAMYTI